MKRVLWLLLVVVLVAGAAAGGWYAASRTKTPAEIAAEAEPPEPSLIAAPVELIEISTSLLLRGDVLFDEPETIVSGGVAVEGLAPVVTMIPTVGSELAEGSVMYEISGRPTFVFQGELPLFRDLRPGDDGEDIAQFQEALVRSGYSPGPIDGIYGSQTQAAVEALYRDAGYEALGPSEVEWETIELASDAVEQAQQVYDAALKARVAAQTAANELAVAEAAEAVAAKDLALAQDRLEQAVGGTHPDTDQPPTDGELAELESEVSNAQDIYDQSLERTAAAVLAVEIAGPVQAITAENKALTDARRDLSELHASIGTVVPTSEITFVGVLPIRVDELLVARGDSGAGGIMSVSGSRLAIDSAVSIDESDSVEVGATVDIEQARLGIFVTGTVAWKADRTGTDGAQPDEYALEILPDEVIPELAGTNVKITIPIRSTGGEVLAVPLSALTATAGGDAIVTVVAEDGSVRTVTVKAGLSSSGLVQVDVLDGELSEGDQVVIGQQ